MKKILSLLLALIFIDATCLLAQFNGDFEIKRHYLKDENFFDWKAYQYPLSWEYEWWQITNGMRGTVGSISQERFYSSHELKLEKKFNNQFTFSYFQESDELVKSEKIYQELEFKWGKEYGIGIIGYPQYEKKFGNTGLSLSYRERNSFNFFRFSHLNLYALYNEKNTPDDKNSGDDKYIELPVMDRLEIKQKVGDFLFIFDGRYEHFTEYQTVDKDRQTYLGHQLKARIHWEQENAIYGFIFFKDYEKRELKYNLSSQQTKNKDQELKLNWFDLFGRLELNGKDYFTLGIMQNRFLNRIDSKDKDETYYFNLVTNQLYATYEPLFKEEFHWLFSFQTGNNDLEKVNAGNSDEDKFNYQLKAGIGIIFKEDKNYRLFGNSTWDLDAYRYRQWDGGNIQLQLYF